MRLRLIDLHFRLQQVSRWVIIGDGSPATLEYSKIDECSILGKALTMSNVAMLIFSTHIYCEGWNQGEQCCFRNHRCLPWRSSAPRWTQQCYQSSWPKYAEIVWPQRRKSAGSTASGFLGMKMVLAAIRCFGSCSHIIELWGFGTFQNLCCLATNRLLQLLKKSCNFRIFC